MTETTSSHHILVVTKNFLAGDQILLGKKLRKFNY